MEATSVLSAQNSKYLPNQHRPLICPIKQGNFGISVEKRDDKIMLLMLVRDTNLKDLEIRSEQNMLTIEVDRSNEQLKNEIAVIIEINEGEIVKNELRNIHWHALEMPVPL